MFHVGDLIIYSARGICRIDDICEKTYSGVTKTYYVLHPLEDTELTISTPVDNEQVVMLGMIQRDEAQEVLDSFKLPGITWEENGHQRYQIYADIVKSGDRSKISKIVNTLMRKKHEAEKLEKKLLDQDRKLLASTQKILFSELAISLNTTFDVIDEEANRLIRLSD